MRGQPHQSGSRLWLQGGAGGSWCAAGQTNQAHSGSCLDWEESGQCKPSNRWAEATQNITIINRDDVVFQNFSVNIVNISLTRKQRKKSLIFNFYFMIIVICFYFDHVYFVKY